MRRPSESDLEFTMLLFLVLAPVGYFTVRWLLSIFS